MSKRPNILYLHSHDTGCYVQPYGYNLSTPNIQRIAEEGVLFRQAFCVAPTCSPSRASLLTGQFPHNCGQFGLVNRGFELRDREKHIANLLSDAGYHTALVGCHHVVRDPITCGYIQHIQERIKHVKGDLNTVRAAIKFLRHPPREPFFLSVGFYVTHRPFPECRPRKHANYCLPPIPIPDTPRTRMDMCAFKLSVSLLDNYVGAILDALNNSSLAKNTVVILTTDHGVPFPKMKCNLTDHGIHVMLIMRGPSGFSGGKVIDALVSQLDLYPTICELAEIDLPKWVQGVSLLPLVNGKTKKIHEEIFAEVNYHAAYEPMRAIRTQRWKYIRRFHDYPFPVLPNCDPSPSKDVLMECGWGKQVIPREELYDLMLDSTESHNLSNNPKMEEILFEMRRRLDQWMRCTGDPLLQEPIPLPDGAYVCKPDDIQPNDIWKRVPRPEGYA